MSREYIEIMCTKENGLLIVQMNLSEFKRSINMGMGSAILELMKNQGSNEKYREAVLYACLNNTCYDAQSETRRHTNCINEL